MFLQRPNEDMIKSVQYQKNYVLHELSSDMILGLIFFFHLTQKPQGICNLNNHPQKVHQPPFFSDYVIKCFLTMKSCKKASIA